jgi:SAM-dependent methyltransferase
MEMMPAERLFQMITGFAVSQAIYVAARLGIADLLKDGPKGTAELAKSAGADHGALYRLLRFLASQGIFAECDNGRFKLTSLGECLQTGAPDSMRDRAIFWGEEWIWRPWGELLYSVRTGLPAFDHIYGVGAFDYLAQNPKAAEIFHETIRAQAAWESAAVVAAYDFSGIGNIVDIGCGDGSLLAAILKANAGARGVFFDQSHVIEKASSLVEAAKVGDRCELVAGNFFESAPAGGDAYVLKHIVHNWDDARAIAILQNCRRCMTRGGRILILECVIRPGNEPDMAKFIDVHMLVRQPGRERTEGEYRDLLTAAGFNPTRIVPTRSQVSVIEGVPA